MIDKNSLSLAFMERKPKAAATLLQDLTPEHSADFLQQVPVPILAPVIDNMASWPAARVLSLLPAKVTASVLRQLAHIEAETLLRLMDSDQRNAVIGKMPAAVAKKFQSKMAYPVSTVGAWMDTSIPCFNTDTSVEHCLDLVRRRKSHLGGIAIVIHENKTLAGVISLEKLLTSDKMEILSNLVDANIAPLSSRATLWEVEHHESWTSFPSLPVINRNDIVLGALTHSALRAGTRKTGTRTEVATHYSLLSHLAKAFMVSLGGMFKLVSGMAANTPEMRYDPPSTTDIKAAETGYDPRKNH